MSSAIYAFGSLSLSRAAGATATHESSALRMAASAGCGGAVSAAGNALFAWRLFADGIAVQRRIVRSVYAAEVLKWCWLVLALYLAVAVLKVPALPFVVGIIAAQVAFWISLAVV